MPSLLGPELREPFVELQTLWPLGAIPGPRGVRDDRGAPGRADGGLQGALYGAAGTSRLARLNAAVRDLVLGALDRAGGEDYLVQQAQTNPTAFLTLVGKCLPTKVEGDAQAPVTFVVQKPW